GPTFPRPSTAVPSVRTATEFGFMGGSQTRSGSSAMAQEIRPKPGVYAIDRSSRVFSGNLGVTAILPPACMSKVRSDTARTSTPGTRCAARTIEDPCASSRHLIVTSRTTTLPRCSTRSTAPMSPPARPIELVSRPSAPGMFSRFTRIVSVYPADGVSCAMVAGDYRPFRARDFRGSGDHGLDGFQQTVELLFPTGLAHESDAPRTAG